MNYLITWKNSTVILAHFSITAESGEEALKSFHNICGENATITDFRRLEENESI